jgi:hypothetical protein
MSLEKYIFENELFAIVLRNDFNEDGVTFFTENHLSQQLAFMKHKKGKTIQPHIHKPLKRIVEYTQEVLYIKKGILRVDFYNSKTDYIKSIELFKGDTILLIKGGHGFEIIEDVEMLEVKQGPFAGDNDKIRF